MKAAGRPPPKTTLPTLTSRVDRGPPVRGALDGGGHEVAEQRVRLLGAALELRVELRRQEPRMVLELDDLDEVLRRVHAGDDQARVLEELAELVVDLVAVAVA